MAHVFDIDDDAATELTMTRFRTFFIYGLPRHGKTRFIGTCPNALVIADASERGYTTLKTMKDQPGGYYHDGHGPFVIAVENGPEMNLAIAIAEVGQGRVHRHRRDRLGDVLHERRGSRRRRRARGSPSAPSTPARCTARWPST